MTNFRPPPPPPRICILAGWMSAGGVRTMVNTLCRRLLAEGCQVDLICLSATDRLSGLTPSGVRVMMAREAYPRISEGNLAMRAVRAFVIAAVGLLRRLQRSAVFITNAVAGRRLIRGPQPAKKSLAEYASDASSWINPLLDKAGLRTFWRLWMARRRIARTQHSEDVWSLHAMADCSVQAAQVAGHLDAAKPDAVYAAGNKADIVALLACGAARHKPRLAVSMHSRANRNCYAEAFQREQIALLRLLLSTADVVHAVSEGVAEETAREFHLERSKITCLHNPAFRDEMRDLQRQPCDHPWIAQKGGEKIILWAGRLEGEEALHQKDCRTLLRAFEILSDKQDARLLLLGPQDDRVKSLAREWGIKNNVIERIQGVGFVENPYCWMASADAFVLSSVCECLPTVLIEAMGCGCPVVSTDCDYGPREILEDGRRGRLTPAGDAGALAAAIDATLKNPPPAEELLARAGDFSEEKIMPGFLEMLGLARDAEGRICFQSAARG